ncbi:MAG: TIGR00725 family protein [bacterium]|nr:TIGR00725 family protein [bacterium]MCS7309576.1 TIGR00725 family protein [Armatimonadota bacterium]MDW8105640.1 TIGR00725 family protein [Armatimonadota bacterium]
MSRTYRIVIGVMGASACDDATYELARRVGALIAERGAVLLCGGRGGVMEAAAQGAKEAGGLTIGVMPGMNANESPPNPYVDVAIFTGLRDGRNWVNVCASDAIIAIAGGYGTLSEIALALKVGKPVVLLRSWELPARGHAPLFHAQTPEQAVDIAFQQVVW